MDQDADIVGFLFRPAYYEVLEPGQHSEILLNERTELQPVEVIVAKNRHGRLYTASVHYTPVRGVIDPIEESFDDLERELVPNPVAANAMFPAITNGRLKDEDDLPF